MKRFFIPLLAAFTLPTAVNANIDPKVAEMCMKAADYKGCIELNTRKSSLPRCNFLLSDNCNGELNWSNGKYVGEISNSKRNGYGTMTWASGNKYVGEWKDGKMNGSGTYTKPSGMKYVGQWKEGDFHGRGALLYPSGDKYVGQWRNDKEYGYGTYTWMSGNKYVGEWKDGKMNGSGTYFWSDGSSWTGQFLNNKRTDNGSYNYSREEKEAARKMQLEMIRQTNDLMKSIYGNNQRIDLYMY